MTTNTNFLNNTLPDLSKLEPLNDKNYKRWSQKILLIFFEQLKVDYVLFEDVIKAIQNASVSSSTANLTVTQLEAAKTVTNALKKKEKDNKMVRGHLLHHLSIKYLV